MELELKNDKLYPQFDWIGLVILIFGVHFLIVSLEAMSIFARVRGLLMPGCLVIILLFLRRYNWKNITAALVILFTLPHPIRIIFHWALNPVLYGLTFLICLILMIRVVRKYHWKNTVVVLLMVCILLTGWQTAVSITEVGHCYVEDVRWSRYFHCRSSDMGYQQIDSLPLGMHGYCYFCFWY